MALMFLLIVSVSVPRTSAEEMLSSTSTTTTPPVLLAPGNWVVMGSSTAAGSGAPRGKGWVALVDAAFAPRGVKVANIAKRGAVTYHGLSMDAFRIARRPAPARKANIDAALAHKPALIVLSYPSNDTAFGYSSEESINNLLAIRAQAQAAGVAVIVMSTQPRNLVDVKLAQLRAIDDRLSEKVGACFLAVRPALEGANGRLAAEYDAGDGVHLTTKGHAFIAARLTELIESGHCVRLGADRRMGNAQENVVRMR